MGVPDRLRSLDRRVLPPIGAAMARLGRGARRVRLLTFGAVAISLAVVLVAVYAAGRAPAVSAGPPAPIVRMGVPEGGSIPRYVSGATKSLRRLVASTSADPTPPAYFALVSMSSYLTPQKVTDVFAGLPIQITNVIMRVPSEKQTQIITLYATDLPHDVIRGMLSTANQKAQEVADDQTRLSDVTGDSTAADTLRSQYRLEKSVAELEVAAYRRLCGCVYAAVVYAAPAVLGQLAARAHVRAVEVAPAHQSLDRAVFLPPFPDQHRTARPPGPSPS
jgi:hypothetical protein